MGLGLAVRVGCTVGLCRSQRSAGRQRDTVVLGETPNIAARMQSVAEPGEVVISAATGRLVAGWFVIEDTGVQAMKGVPEPMTLQRVLRPSAARSRLEARSLRGLAPIVGRAGERQLLLDAWNAVVRGGAASCTSAARPASGSLASPWHCASASLGSRTAGSRAPCTLYVQNTAFHPMSRWWNRCSGSSRATDRLIGFGGSRPGCVPSVSPRKKSSLWSTVFLALPRSELECDRGAEPRSAPAPDDRRAGRVARRARAGAIPSWCWWRICTGATPPASSCRAVSPCAYPPNGCCS